MSTVLELMSTWRKKILDSVGLWRRTNINSRRGGSYRVLCARQFPSRWQDLSKLLGLWPIQMRRRRIPLIASGLAIAIGLVILGVPAGAQQVQVSPSNPRLGDTLSVVVQQKSSGSTPVVRMNRNTYKMFPIGANTYRAFLPTTPLESPGTRQIQIQANDGVENVTVNVGNRSFPTQRIRITSSRNGGLEPTQYELDRVSAFKAQITPEKYWNGRFIAPNKGRLSTGYGVRRYYNGVFAKNYYHRGLDYAGGYGSPVVAPAAGRVGLVGKLSQGFRLHGNTVGIDHGQGVTSVFLHLSRIDVQEGDFVQAGQVIGAIGATGATTGPHLHWGFYVNAKSVDPAPWLSQTME